MSITPLKRLTLYGIAEEKESVLEGLQELGCCHLVGLRPSIDRHEEAPTAHPKEMYDALRYLMRSPIQRQTASDEEEFDSDAIVEKALWNRVRLRMVRDRLDELRYEIQELERWGDFTTPPPEDLGGLRLWFYILLRHELKHLRASDLTWQVVTQDHRHAYVVVISEKEPPESMPGVRVHIGPRSRSSLKREEERAVAEEEEILAERWVLTRWTDLLRRDLARAENRAALEFAATQTLDAAEVFAVQGWVPAGRVAQLRRFAEARGLACTVVDPEPLDSPPVLLANKHPVAAGEDLVSFFQLPGYRDWDPSAIVFVSFVLFFAMILSDAGYALVLGLGTLLLWRRMGRSPTGARLRRLASAIVVTAVAYGALVGSYFGLAPGPDTALAPLKRLDINDFNSMMQLSVVIGAVHVVLANSMVAWNRRRSLTAIASLGWIIGIAGGLALVLGRSSDALQTWGWSFVVTGLVAILLFSGQRYIKTPIDVLWRILEGLKAVTGVTTAVGDVLSYLRLFALGLSSASLAITFNGLANQAVAAVPGIGLLFGLGILLLGHVLNIILAVMSGVVHGLRLNLIEFYKWGISDEGSPFNAFRKKKETMTWTR